MNAGAAARTAAWWQVLSWQMYDFADTIFSMNVYTFYFGLWMTQTFHVTSDVYGWTLTAGNLVAAVLSPLLGAASDLKRRRLPFLRLFALGCAFFTAAIAFTGGSVYLAMLTFFFAYTCYNAAWGFYNALLPGIAHEGNVSMVSGIGVGLGYVGAAVGLQLVKPFVAGGANPGGAFVPSALFYLVFALPCLLLVPDFARGAGGRAGIRAAYAQVAHTFAQARQYRGLFLFLVADFLYENAVAAVVALMAIYSNKVMGLPADAITDFFLVAIPAAVVFSFIYGWLTDRIGPKPAVLFMLAIWLVVFPLVIFTRDAGVFQIVIGPLAGMGLGATWVSSRTYLVALTPVQQSGEFFGLFNLSGKSAGVVGNLAWAAAVSVLAPRLGEVAALRYAVGLLLLFIVAGLVLILFVPRVRPTRANMLQR